MPMIAKTGTIAKPRGKKQYSSPIGPDKDPGEQLSKMAHFQAGYLSHDPGPKPTEAAKKNQYFKEGKAAGKKGTQLKRAVLRQTHEAAKHV